MLERAKGQFTIEGNVEDIFGGIGGAARIARISQSCRFSGQLEGESMAEFTAVLPREGDGSFHGFQRVSGTLGEREGTFVLSVTGEYVKGQPRGTWTIVPKSGSGDFLHIRGSGTFSLPDGKPGTYQLEFDARKPRAARTTVTSEAQDEAPALPEAPATVIEQAPIVATAQVASVKPARKPRPKKVEPPIEPVMDVTPQLTRTRKGAPEAVPPVVAAEPAPKQARSRKAEPAVPLVATDVEAVPKPKRARKPIAVVVEPAPTPPATKPKRTRKSAAEPSVEPATAAADSAPEVPQPTPSRRAKPVVPDPIPLLETAPATQRRRRAKAA